MGPDRLTSAAPTGFGELLFSLVKHTWSSARGHQPVGELGVHKRIGSEEI